MNTAPVQFTMPTEIPVRLSVIAVLTGVPESTLREAALLGDLRAWRKHRAWHTSLHEFHAWVTSESESRRDRRAASKRKVQSLREDRREEDLGERAESERSTSETPKEAKGNPKPRKRKAIVYELFDPVDSK